MNDRIIFLDVDGVLNRFPPKEGDRYSWPPKSKDTDETAESLGWLPLPVSIIHDFALIYDCKIVLSTSWRSDISTKQVAQGLGIPESYVIGATKHMLDGRGGEIARWRMDNDHTGPFVVIDDSMFDIESHPDMEGHTVRTKTRVGLTEEHIPLIVKCLDAQ